MQNQRQSSELIDGYCFETRQPGSTLPQLPRFGMSSARVALTIDSGAGIESSWRPLLGRCPTSRDFVPWRFWTPVRHLDARAVGRGEGVAAAVADDALKIVMRGEDKEDRAAA